MITERSHSFTILLRMATRKFEFNSFIHPISSAEIFDSLSKISFQHRYKQKKNDQTTRIARNNEKIISLCMYGFEGA